MIGKILGAMAGASFAKQARGISGPGGALLGAGAVAVARRFGPLGLIATGLGAYMLKKRNERNERPAEGPSSRS